MQTTATNAVKAAATTSVAMAPSILATLSAGALMELIASSICGAAIFMLWSDEIPLPKRLLLGGISATMGVLLGPYVGVITPSLNEGAYNFCGALIGALSAVVIKGALEVLKDGDILRRFIGKKTGGHDD